MEDFNKKLEFIDTQFIYLFTLLTHNSQKTNTKKIMLFSVDNNNEYFSVAITPEKGKYLCGFGPMFIGGDGSIVFGDIANPFFIEPKDYKLFKRFYDKQPKWSRELLSDIINFYNIDNVGFVK